MNYKKYIFSLAGCLLLSLSSYAYRTPESERPLDSNTASGIPVADIRVDCARSASQIDQAINNVRARLQTGGDVWWDRSNGRYIVPKVPQGQIEVSSIFAGAVWLGGVDPGGNLKVACQTYGPGTDFWPGPLDEDAEISEEDCRTWDRFFVVTGEDVREHRSNFLRAQNEGVDYDPNDIPESIKGWPALGNEFFEDIHEFRLPFDEANGLAGFWDYGDNGVPDGRYNPELGDFPIVEIRGCTGFPVTFPDEMIFWIYNDKGNVHTETNAESIGMEVQVQAFAFQSDDEINNMTFQRYKLINRAVEPINETYFAMWVDGDLGCFDDDYIGCDVERSLAYYYNQDIEDGNNGTCPQGTPSYGFDVPALGVDYFRGPLDENFEELGMSSFTYYNNNSIGGPWPQGTTDPQTGPEYYNYLSGNWRDGTSFSQGGSGYDPGNPNLVDYAFIDPPNQSGGWSMCEEQSPQGDRRTIQASGPFTLLPGAKNELIVGVVWIEELNYPCPSINNLLLIDDVAQALFDNCFEITRGPSAPDVDFVELDRELVCILTNDPGNNNNNNIHENYQEKDLRAPDDGPEFLYRFEGYQVYQLAGPTSNNLDDPDQARIIREMDIQNGVSKVYNWNPIENPLDANNSVWTPTLEADGPDEGIDHTFLITEDQFASGDRTLINHKTYYFTVIAYGYNNWEDFRVDNGAPLGQRAPYISGDLNIRTYTPVPRPIYDQNLNTFYGDGVELERLEGKGSGGFFLEFTDETADNILDSDDNLVYKPGQGPVDIKIINPLEVKDGNYELTFSDDSMGDDDLSPTTRWVLENLDNGDIYEAEKPIDTTSEQIIQELGISIKIGTPPTVGDLTSESNGAVGAELNYKSETAEPWFFGIGGTEQFATFIDNTDPIDINGSLTGSLMDPGYFVPFILTRPPNAAFISPMIEDNAIYSLMRQATSLEDLNNVDIVFTSDKSKWSRCMIIETSTRQLSDANQANWPTENGAKHFQLRKAPSVTKEAGPDGLPVVDNGASRDGFGYFPGYAVDVETGQRLNIFFGEASSYDCDALTSAGLADDCENFLGGDGTGRDMMWNPVPQDILLTSLPQMNIANGYLGGHHWIYVTRTEYDGCEELAEMIEDNNPITKRNGLAQITWTSAAFPMRELNSYADGLIPEDFTYSLRVSKPLAVDKSSAGENEGYPKYRFKIEGKEAQDLEGTEELDEQLAGISIVPNPYYGFSNYETSATSTTVKITNLPNECEINIFSLEGKFIRSYDRNVGPNTNLSRGGVVAVQATPSVEWDLKNSKGIPVASGTYLINVNAPGVGERTLKLFLVQRQFDPSGL